MVIVRLMGGLGNQLFQYAAARRVAWVNNVPLKLDVSSFAANNFRKYSLEHFDIAGHIASPQEIARFNKSRSKRVIRLASRLVNKLRPYHERPVIRERHFYFDPNMLKVSGQVYLDGYWQSEKYFKDIEEVIRREFKVKHRFDKANEQVANSIMNTESVSLHVRRSDYVLDTQVNQVHGVCPLDYYYAAIQALTKFVVNPHFFIFSDDPQWAKGNLKLSHPVTFVTHNNADKDYEDLRLMTICKHHIIANSTFSWWGAWLCEHPAKMVFAPKIWFRTDKRNTKDLIPDSWYVL